MRWNNMKINLPFENIVRASGTNKVFVFTAPYLVNGLVKELQKQDWVLEAYRYDNGTILAALNSAYMVNTKPEFFVNVVKALADSYQSSQSSST